MNEQNVGGGSFPSTAETLPYKDRSTGLVVFGILTILLGCLSALMVFFMLLGQVLAGAIPNAPPPAPFSALLPALCMYVGMAVALVWLGIGSIKARRWARALLLIFSWSWLLVGLIAMASLVFILPKLLVNISAASATAGHPPVPAAALGVVMVFAIAFDGVLFILLPAIWTFFYSSRHVKLTCEWRDPVSRWTDACPLPVLGVCMWLVYAMAMLVIMPLVGFGVAPFFGMFLTGFAGSLFYLFMAAMWGLAGWWMYRLDLRGWWLIVIALCIYGASSIVTFSQHDILEMYRLMGYPQAQLDQIQKTGILEGNYLVWMTVFSMVPFLGYLIFVRRYFRQAA